MVSQWLGRACAPTPLAPLGESVCGLQRAFHIQAVSRSPAVFTSHRAPSGPCVFEQPLGQAWVCGGLILPSVVSPFQDLPVNFLASPLGCGSPHLHLNLRLEELQVPIRGWHRLCPLLLIKPAPSGSDTDAFHGQQKCPSLLLFLPEAPKFLTNKRCSFCRLPLANFQSLENSCFWHFCLVLQLFFCKHYLSTSSFLHSWKSPASFKNAGRMTCLLLSKVLLGLWKPSSISSIWKNSGLEMAPGKTWAGAPERLRGDWRPEVMETVRMRETGTQSGGKN